jgi:hypothetical protein
MLSTIASALTPVLVVEGEYDIFFLSSISATLHRQDAVLPDLAELASARRLVFLPPEATASRRRWHALAVCNCERFSSWIVSRNRKPANGDKSLPP